MSARLVFGERAPGEPGAILAFAGIGGAPMPTRTLDDRDKPPFALLKTTGRISFEWASGFGPFKHVSASTILPETNPCAACVISDVEVLYVPKADYDRWLDSE